MRLARDTSNKSKKYNKGLVLERDGVSEGERKKETETGTEKAREKERKRQREGQRK